MVAIKAEIEAQVASLIGLRLANAGRAVDMATFGFGDMIVRSGPRGPVQLAQYRLHIQETWRVTRDRGVLLGYGDWHYPPRGSVAAYEDFGESDEPRNMQDDLRDDWLRHGPDAHTVVKASGTNAGDLAIAFADGCCLETFVNQASNSETGSDEVCRLIPPPLTGDEAHFVVTVRGVESGDIPGH